jgi:spore maturation protein CgeB
MYWMKSRGYDIFERQYIYDIMKNEAHPLSDTFKKIREHFDAISEDVVANEGKGIFYAKNRLGMHDRQHIENKNVDSFDFDE